MEVGAARADRLEAAHVEEAEPSLPLAEARWVLLIMLHTTLALTVLHVPRQPCSPVRKHASGLNFGQNGHRSPSWYK